LNSPCPHCRQKADATDRGPECESAHHARISLVRYVAWLYALHALYSAFFILTLLTLRWQEYSSFPDASDLGLGTDSVLPGSSAGAALFSAYQEEVRRQQALANANANSNVLLQPDVPQQHQLKTSANAAASERSDNADRALEAELGLVPRRSAERSPADASASTASIPSTSVSASLPVAGHAGRASAGAGAASARSSDRDADASALRLPPLMRAATVLPPRSAAAVAATSSLIIKHEEGDEEASALPSSSNSEASQSILALASTLNRIGSRQASPLAGARSAPPLGQIESSLASIMAASLLSAEAEAAAYTAADVESMSVSKMVSQRQATAARAAAAAAGAAAQTSVPIEQQHAQHDAPMRAPSPTKRSRILHAASQSQAYPASNAMSEMEEYYQVRHVA
jgi:hypothetical protein